MENGRETLRNTLKNTAKEIFTAALGEVSPKHCINKSLKLSGNRLSVHGIIYDLCRIEKLYLIGAGKASASMALEAEKLLGDRIHDGLIVTKYDHGIPLKHCHLLEAGHPVPDINGCKAAEALLDITARAGINDLILCLISGGGSALTPAPVSGINLADKQEITRLLLSSGATIHEINAIRKHLSRIKGGRLCQATGGADIVSLILSDVIGDDLDIIASGLTSPDPSTFNDCLSILTRYNLLEQTPVSVLLHLNEGAKGRHPETPKPGDEIFAHVSNWIIGSISDALQAADKKASLLGFQSRIVTPTLQGEAREAAKTICNIAREIDKTRTTDIPICLLSGGETTVTVTGPGKGGRNTELALAAAIELSGLSNIMILSAGTDGTDGSTDAAGAFADGSTVTRAEGRGLAADRHLADNDSYNYFRSLQDLFITGPTRTNVMDLQILLIS